MSNKEKEFKEPFLQKKCDGCGKGHCFMIPNKPGTYHMGCRTSKSSRISLTVDESGQVHIQKSKI